MVLSVVQSAPPSVGLVSKLQFYAVNPETGVNIQPHIALRTLVPCPEVLFLGGKLVTTHEVSFLWPMLTTLHFQPAGQRGWCFPWGDFT
jgi:hypothetical protein